MPRHRYDEPPPLQKIENTRKGRDDYGYGWGSSPYIITKEQLLEVLNGKCLALYDGEYTSFVALEDIEYE